MTSKTKEECNLNLSLQVKSRNQNTENRDKENINKTISYSIRIWYIQSKV